MKNKFCILALIFGILSTCAQNSDRKCKYMYLLCQQKIATVSAVKFNLIIIMQALGPTPMLGGVSVPTAWRALGLRMEKRPPAMKVSCEYIE
jgi:hypothetical protein